MQLVRLTRLGKSTLEERMQELSKIISDLESILSQEAKIKAVIKEEILELKEKFSSERKTEFVPDPGELDIEDLIDDEELIFAMTSAGYVKTMALSDFNSQGRGGKGVTGAKLKDEDALSHMIHTTAHAYLLFFSNKGKVID